MARRLINHTACISSTLNIGKVSIFGGTQNRKLNTRQIPVKEIKIPVQWGHISAKLWGNENERPILALHGWQDNAGTWDPLAPMLCHNQPILTVDFPGHGLSSWLPPGLHYYAWDLPRLILYLKNYFKWEKVSFLSHSMGSIASFRFATIFPDDVDFYIAVDILFYDDYDMNLVIENYSKKFAKIELEQTRLDKEPLSYSLDDITKIWHLGTKKSVAMESVKYLLKRGAKPSKQDPNKLYFSRDARLKHILFNPENKKFVEGLALRLKCPTLYFKGTDSPYATDAFSVEMQEMIAKNNSQFECAYIPGTHHVHLNDAEKLAPVIENFLRKHKLWK